MFGLSKQDVDKLKAKRDIKGLIRIVRRKNESEFRDRDRAIEALGEIGDSRGIEPLFQVLETDSDKILRQGAALAIGKMGNPQALERLLPFLEDKEDWVVEATVSAISRIGDSRAIEPLIKLLGKLGTALSAGDVVRCLEIISEKGDLRIVKILFDTLEVCCRSEWLRTENSLEWTCIIPLAKALNKLGGPDICGRATELLLERLARTRASIPRPDVYKNPDYKNENIVMEALGEIGDSRAIEAIVQVFPSPEDVLWKTRGQRGTNSRWQSAYNGLTRLIERGILSSTHSSAMYYVTHYYH